MSREEEGGTWEATIGLSECPEKKREECGRLPLGCQRVFREEGGGVWEVSPVTIGLSENVQGRRGRGVGGYHWAVRECP